MNQPQDKVQANPADNLSLNGQGYYVPAGIPAEPPAEHPGLTEGIMAIVCAIIALGFFPPILGITGILLGVKARKKGQDSLGLVAIVLSSVCMVAGITIGIWVANQSVNQGALMGLVG